MEFVGDITSVLGTTGAEEGGSFLVQRDRQWHLFYTAVNSAHNGKHSHGPSRTLIMHATTGSIWA